MSETTTFVAKIGYWNGACYETAEWCDLDATTLPEAIAEISAMPFDLEERDFDIRVTIQDEDGNEVATEYFQKSVAEDLQDNMDDTWEDKGEFSTDCIGIKKGQWYTWTRNGGSRGAHDRMHGSGRWIERYDLPKKIEPAEALDWLMKNKGLDLDEAIEAMADGDTDRTEADLVKEIGECLWRGGESIGVYRIRGTLYTVDCGDMEQVDRDEALEFVADRDDEEACEKFERLL